MTDTDSIQIILTAIEQIAPDVDAASIRWDADLREDLGLDSMDFLNIVAAVHNVTGVDVPERDYPKIATVESFAAYLASSPDPAGPSG